MSLTGQLESGRILSERPNASVEAIHRRRRSATVALLRTFEATIEPLLPPGSETTIESFKALCRQKINGLAFEGLRATQTRPGESLSGLTPMLAEDLAFDNDDEGA